MAYRPDIRAVGTAVIAGILGWSAWRYGLFFDADAYAVEMAVFGAAVIGLVWGLRCRGTAAVPLLAMLPLGMAVCYGVTLLGEPASVKGTVDSMLRWTAFAGWTVSLAMWWRNPARRAWGEAAIQTVGLFLLLGGWFGWFGWLTFPDIVLHFDDPQLSAAGVRLAGFLQYPNAYGAVMAFFLLRQWQLWAGSVTGAAAGAGAGAGSDAGSAAGAIAGAGSDAGSAAGAVAGAGSDAGSAAGAIAGAGSDAGSAVGAVAGADKETGAAAHRGKIAVWLAGLTAVPYAGALLLTESRGAMVALFIGFIAALVLAGDHRVRLRLGLAAAWTVPGALVAAQGALGSIGAAGGTGHTGVWLTAAAMAAGSAVLLGLRKWLASVDLRGEDAGSRIPYARQAVLSFVMIAGCLWFYLIVVGAGAQGRLVGHYATAASRLLFYRDGWRMFLDSPWLGFGGDSWRTLYGLYQTQPYVGGEVHSGYLEMALDTGLLGLGFFMVMMGIWSRRVWRVRREALAPAAVLLAHAAADFDLSYGWIWLLLLAWFALFAAKGAEGHPVVRRRFSWFTGIGAKGTEGRPAVGRGFSWFAGYAAKEAQGRPAGGRGFSWFAGFAAKEAQGRPAGGRGFSWFAGYAAKEAQGRPAGGRPVWGGVAAILLIGASAWGAWAAWHGHAAARAVGAADRAATPAAREAELRAALAANPAWGRIRLALAPLLPQAEERESVLAAGLRYEPQSAPLMLRLGLAEAERGRVAQAESRLREALRLERFSRDGQTAAIAAMVRLADTLRFHDRADEARRADEAAVSFYERYRQLVQEVAAMKNPANGKRFGMTPAAEFNTAEAFLALHRADEARPLLQRLVEGDDAGWKQQAQQLLDGILSPPQQ